MQVAGARQVGKSTLAQAVAGRDRRIVSLDDDGTRARAAQDPDGLLAAFGDDDLLIDEVQRVPSLYLAMKRVVDEDPSPGRYLVTGSAEPANVALALDSLAGRIGIVELRPFSRAEQVGAEGDFVHRLLDDAEPVWRSSGIRGFAGYLDDVLVGGYPEPIHLDEAARQMWFDAYLRAIFARDARAGARIEDTGRLARLFQLIASHSGQLLKPSSLARDAELAKNTALSWTSALASTRIIDVIPAWSAGSRGRVVGTPKGFVLDTGLLASTLGVSRDRVLADPMLTGAFAKTFAVQEVLRLMTSYPAGACRPFHYRDRDQREVDLVIEDRAGRLVAIEVKASASAGPSDARGIAALSRLAGGRVKRGIVLYCGEHPVPLGDGVMAVPMANLWAS